VAAELVALASVLALAVLRELCTMGATLLAMDRFKTGLTLEAGPTAAAAAPAVLREV
jgi:hypothetical protein